MSRTSRVLAALLVLLATALPAHAQAADALDVSRAELRRGDTFTATAVFYRDAPAAIAVDLALPPGVQGDKETRVQVDGVRGSLVTWQLTVAEDAPLSRAPVPIGLRVDGVEVDQVAARIWTDAEIQKIFLPMVEK